MVFAVAALFLQFAPGALGAPIGATVQPITRESEAPTSPATPAPIPDASILRDPESSSSTHYNFDKVSLTTGSKEPSPPKLNAVSLESSSDIQILSNIRIPEIQPGKPEEVKMAERRRYTRSWLALSIVQHGAATFDAYSTRQSISRGNIEDDPMMRPFAHSGAIYAAIQAGPVALDLIARRMQHSEFSFVRRMWWIPQTVSTGSFIFAGVHNLSVAGRH
jgi:hypothetical protein